MRRAESSSSVTSDVSVFLIPSSQSHRGVIAAPMIAAPARDGKALPTVTVLLPRSGIVMVL